MKQRLNESRETAIVRIKGSLNKNNNERPMKQEAFLRKYNRYNDKYSEIKKEIEYVRKQIELTNGNAVLFKRKIEDLKKTNQISEFSDILFLAFVKKVIVDSDGTLKFHFITNFVISAKK